MPARKTKTVGAQEFEDYGEQVYCIDAQSGEYSVLDPGHFSAEYRSEDGRLFFMVGRRINITCMNMTRRKKKYHRSLPLPTWGIC